MKRHNDITIEELAMLQRIKEAMGDAGLAQASSIPMRQAMEDEYLRLTTATLKLLSMLGRISIQDKLSRTENSEYNKLMAEIAQAATSGHEKVQSSQAMDRNTLLAAMPVEMSCMQ